ncbi:dihydroxyacetone kinase family protein [Microbacterium ulmi]|uniref:Dihydroxyacetone kinase family protein n=1 Tax=Microbacterium ulmi TaxID=179095 RepID=A0A7Y2M3E6_9MICO|nr:dihydroxyacetone kinase family protein [Microbacterium ulmi]NNH05034.1 dihydroxyacetone kinase family protein [Microbacterium ulmi]
MTRLLNAASDFVAEALDGFVALHSDRVARVDGGVVRADGVSDGQVAVVVGGGSGHYPAFAGVVGPGLAAGAVCGQIFTSPSAGQAYRVARAAQSGAGVLFSYGNYAGDVLHFGQAQERLRAEGVDARTVLVTDDIASAPADAIEKRRGIAGDFVVFKIAGAAAERGWTLDEVERVARVANGRTRSLGVAFGGCTFPGAAEPLFTVPDGMMSIGLGIHGEPGIRDVPSCTADELATHLLDPLLADVPPERGDRAVVLVNGLGTVKYEELFILYRAVAQRLTAEGVTIVEPEAGELVTSLDMAGASVTLLWLTPELESLWTDAADSPAYRKGAVAPRRGPGRRVELAARTHAAPDASEESRAAAGVARELLRAAQSTLHAHADELGRIDAYAGDGDHGVGMTRGIDAAVAAAVATRHAGLAATLAAAGDAWSEEAGGTSGALWGAALHAIGGALDAAPHTTTGAAVAARAALDRIVALGGARPGDKTMVDALVPYVERLEDAAAHDAPPAQALADAADAATAAAAATSELAPRLGRARPLAAKSIGHPDAGATSLALITTAISTTVAEGALA